MIYIVEMETLPRGFTVSNRSSMESVMAQVWRPPSSVMPAAFADFSTLRMISIRAVRTSNEELLADMMSKRSNLSDMITLASDE